MSAAVRPRGPLPARVYWVRRTIVLAVAFVLVLGIARVLGGGSDAQSTGGATAVQAGADTSTTPSSTPVEPTATQEQPARRRKKRKPAEPVLAEPSGPCSAADVVVEPSVRKAVAGQGIPVVLRLRTQVSEACTWDFSAESVTVRITSGSDRIWTSQECPRVLPREQVVVRRAAATKVTFTWNARRSDETCSQLTEWALPGTYHVDAAALAGEPVEARFELNRPTATTVTKTVTRSPKPERPKKRR